MLKDRIGKTFEQNVMEDLRKQLSREIAFNTTSKTLVKDACIAYHEWWTECRKYKKRLKESDIAYGLLCDENLKLRKIIEKQVEKIYKLKRKKK